MDKTSLAIASAFFRLKENPTLTNDEMFVILKALYRSGYQAGLKSKNANLTKSQNSPLPKAIPTK